MTSHTPRRLLFSFTLLLLLLPADVWADAVAGRVVDALTQTPLPNARVEVLGHEALEFTNSEGQYRIEGLAPGLYELRITPTGLTDIPGPLRLVRQLAEPEPRETLVPVLTLDFDTHQPPVEMPYGLPSPLSGRFDEPSIGPVDLEVFALEHVEAHPLWLTLPAPLPATIKVGRRFTGNCRDAPVSEIQEIPLEDYVKGVVYAEVGVFGAVEPRDVAAVESWKTFAIAARSYALYWYVRDPDASTNGYHLDDTACKQRYLDTRDAEVDAAVAQTAGMVLIKRGTSAEFDQFEYAASCGEHGSRPEYQTELVPDAVPGQACAGSWCGHDGCAAHEDNPAVPGDDRCLVRGICQWGSVERSKNGEMLVEIMDHYQPNLEIRNFAQLDLTGFVREDDLFEGPPIAEVSVELDGDRTVITDAEGRYLLTDVAPGEHTLRFTRAGYAERVDTLEIFGAGTWWHTVLLAAEGEDVGADTSTGGRDTRPAAGDTVLEPADTLAEDAGADTASGGGVFPALRDSDGATPACSCRVLARGKSEHGLPWAWWILGLGACWMGLRSRRT